MTCYGRSYEPVRAAPECLGKLPNGCARAQRTTHGTGRQPPESHPQDKDMACGFCTHFKGVDGVDLRGAEQRETTENHPSSPVASVLDRGCSSRHPASESRRRLHQVASVLGTRPRNGTGQASTETGVRGDESEEKTVHDGLLTPASLAARICPGMPAPGPEDGTEKAQNRVVPPRPLPGLISG